MGPRLRTTFVLGVLAGLVVALLRALSRDERTTPASLGAPPPALPVVREAVEGSAAAPADAAARPRPELGDDPAPPGETPTEITSEPPAADATAAAVAAAAQAGGDAIDEPELPFAPSEPTWVAPDDGACPDGYPVKAKVSSHIFHVPGGLSYERTKPDRCYPDATSAEADGFRPAKR